jgi:acetate CoA/acetoacetate CoA-transferase beta subunit
MIPGQLVLGMGGTMNLVSEGRRVIVAMNHTQKNVLKIIPELTLPATSLRPVMLSVTEMAAIEPGPDRLSLRARALGVSVDAILGATVQVCSSNNMFQKCHSEGVWLFHDAQLERFLS